MLIFSISHENNINLEGSQRTTKNFKNPLINKISNYKQYESEDEEEEQNNDDE